MSSKGFGSRILERWDYKVSGFRVVVLRFSNLELLVYDLRDMA